MEKYETLLLVVNPKIIPHLTIRHVTNIDNARIINTVQIHPRLCINYRYLSETKKSLSRYDFISLNEPLEIAISEKCQYFCHIDYPSTILSKKETRAILVQCKCLPQLSYPTDSINFAFSRFSCKKFREMFDIWHKWGARDAPTFLTLLDFIALPQGLRNVEALAKYLKQIAVQMLTGSDSGRLLRRIFFVLVVTFEMVSKTYPCIWRRLCPCPKYNPRLRKKCH